MEQDGTRWLNAIITEAGNRISSWILRTIEMIRRELAQKQNLQQTPCKTLLPHPCVDPLFEIKGCDMPKGSCTACGGK